MRVHARVGPADTSVWEAVLPELRLLLRTTAEAIDRSHAAVRHSVPSIENAKRAVVRSRDIIDRTLRRFEARRQEGSPDGRSGRQ